MKMSLNVQVASAGKQTIQIPVSPLIQCGKVLNGYELSQTDKSTILSGGRLNDKHINFAHQILKKQLIP